MVVVPDPARVAGWGDELVRIHDALRADLHGLQLIAGIVSRVEEIAGEPDDGRSPQLIAELDGLSAIMESHFSFEERRIREALDALGGSAAGLLGA